MNRSSMATMNQLNNPARFNKIVQFEEVKQVQNESGHWVDDWVKSDLGTTYAQIRNIRGNEFIMAGAKQAEISARINTRYRKDVEDKYYELGEKLRLTHKNRVFEIEYMNNLEERNAEFEFIVNEVR
ncbi:phage head closure protein [Virgibacillus oceani]